jgi:hypothetical protein
MLTQQDITNHLKTWKPDGLRKALFPLSKEDALKTLPLVIKALAVEYNDPIRLYYPPGRNRDDGGDVNPAFDVLESFVLAHGSWDQVKDMMSYDSLFHDEHGPWILSHRPAWFHQAITAKKTILPWQVVHRFVTHSLHAPPPPGSAYYAFFPGDIICIDHPSPFQSEIFHQYLAKEPSLSSYLLKTPNMLTRDIWHVLEIAGTPRPSVPPRFADQIKDFDQADDTFTNIGGPKWTWQSAFADLAASNKIDVPRLQSALRTLRDRDQARPHLRFWAAQTLMDISPSQDSLQSQLPRLMPILLADEAKLTDTILSLMETQLKAGAISLQDFLNATTHFFTLKSKKTPLQLLKTIEKHATSAHAPHVIPYLAAALTHPQKEVQANVLKLLPRLDIPSHPDLHSTLQAARPLLSPTLQPQFDSLFASTQTKPPKPSKPAPSSTPSPNIDHLSKSLRTLLKLDALASFAQHPHTPLPQVDLSVTDIPQLSDSTRLTPIPDLESLTERLSTALESGCTPQEFELLFDALSRLVPADSNRWKTIAAPLAKRIPKIRVGRSSPAIQYFAEPLAHIAAATGLKKSYSFPWRRGWLRLMANRLEYTLIPNINAQLPLPTLAHPTHTPGWIDPLTLVDRIAAYEKDNAPIDLTDFSLALFRLSAENRPAALKKAKSLTSPAAQALRYALGESIAIPAQAPWELWCAASRAKNPHAADPNLPNSWASLGPDTSAPPTSITLDIKPQKDRYDVFRPSANFAPTPFNSIQVRNLYPAWASQLPQDRMGESPSDSGSNFNYADALALPTLWPAMPERTDLFAALASLRLLAHNNSEVLDTALASACQSAFQSRTRPLSHSAWIALAAGLSYSDAKTRLIAIDTLIQAIHDGRCTGPSLAAGITPCLGTISRFLPRLATSLAEVSRPSLLHAHVAATTIESFLTSVTSAPPHGTPALLSLLADLLATIHQSLAPQTLATLELWAKNKACKIDPQTKSLMKQPPGAFDPAIRTQIHTLALQGRLTFAESFQ